MNPDLPGMPPDAEALYRALRESVADWCRAGALLVGISSGGAWIAERLQRELGLAGECGSISSTMHRDDFAQRGLSQGAPTRLPFAIEGAHLVVIDDVLYTGRTIRAVINELFDFGRPASVKLAVLVDRGGRELPIQPDFVAARVALGADQSLALQRVEGGSFVLELRKAHTG